MEFVLKIWGRIRRSMTVYGCFAPTRAAAAGPATGPGVGRGVGAAAIGEPGQGFCGAWFGGSRRILPLGEVGTGHRRGAPHRDREQAGHADGRSVGTGTLGLAGSARPAGRAAGQALGGVFDRSRRVGLAAVDGLDIVPAAAGPGVLHVAAGGVGVAILRTLVRERLVRRNPAFLLALRGAGRQLCNSLLSSTCSQSDLPSPHTAAGSDELTPTGERGVDRGFSRTCSAAVRSALCFASNSPS